MKMKRILKGKCAACYLLALLLAYGLKTHYSRATSEELGWMLTPTAAAVEHLSGLDFERERGEGYINRARRVIIAPSCAGVNFLIAAACMAIFSYTHCMPTFAGKAAWFGGSLLASYLLTIAVNAVRIVLAMSLFQARWAARFDAAQLHRLAGIAVYCSALCGFFLLLGRVARRSLPQAESRRFASLAPIFWYAAIAILVPLLNPNYQGDRLGMLNHAAVVLIGSFTVWGLLTLLRKSLSRRFSLDFMRRAWHDETHSVQSNKL